jgi:hypothetical protein
LWQGDPLSPLLFGISINPLQCIIQVSLDQSLLQRLPVKRALFRIPLYANDAAIFMDPLSENISTLAQILTNFGNATGLVTQKFLCILHVPLCINITSKMTK